MIIKIERTDKDLSAHAGLVIFKELADSVGLDSMLNDCIPHLKFGSVKNLRKFRQLVLGFQAGAECLDDMDRLAKDGAFAALCGGKTYSSKSFGDFLRSFSALHCKQMNQKLVTNAYGLRKTLFPDADSITIDIDSTVNEQYGKKMEGVKANYAGICGLDTIQVFDEHGLQYWHDVRKGATHTAKGAVEIIHEVFRGMPSSMNNITRYVRADSGYCKIDFFNACAAKNAQFVVCMRKLMYKPLISLVDNWEKQDREDPSRVIFVGSRECEIGETVYRSKNSPITMRAIIIRAVKEECKDQLVLGENDYNYQGWVSNISDTMSAPDVVKKYRGRGHCENFIRELKNGLDLHHYPCQKLLANKAYGLIAAFAYNLMRFVALHDNAKHPQFAKAIRFRFIHLPAQVVRHAGKVVFKFMDDHFKEVTYWLNYVKHIKLGFA